MATLTIPPTTVASTGVIDETTADLPDMFPGGVTYLSDGIVTNKACEFIRDPKFAAVYGASDLHHEWFAAVYGASDLHHEWRMFACIWAASVGARLEGDFVECGVNRGWFALAAMRYLDFDRLGKRFWLFDTYNGIPEAMATDPDEKRLVEGLRAAYAGDYFEETKANFASFASARLVKGVVPDTLVTVEIDRVAYLSIDMNLAAAEMAAAEHFWPRMSPGAMIVIDDYGWPGHRVQREAWNRFAAQKGVVLFPTPMGTGLIVKPF